MIYRKSLYAVFAILLSACTTVPLDRPKTATHTLTNTAETAFDQILADWTAQHPGGESGFYPLENGMDALGARLRLIEGAERSIDAQYFLMKPDDAGEVFAGGLLAAADRGVRVRFLLDDVFTTVDDSMLALLDAHPNIELRIYNPVSRQGLYALNYAGDFSRANRRMHSKSITGDNAFSIVGGRNIADEYFQLRQDTEFLDYEVLAMGPVVAEVSTQFDEFWNSSLSVPMAYLKSNVSEEDLARERAEIAEEIGEGTRSIYRQAIDTDHMLSLVDGTATVYAAPAHLLYDTPAKLENPIEDSQMAVVNELQNMLSHSRESVLVITPYFIPGRDGVNFWRRQADSGISVTIVTNSLASTNHVPVHAAYSRYRKDMLEFGAQLYEVRANAVRPPMAGAEGKADSLTLHTKLMVIDERYLFVGSLNLDPRSIEINAEMGLMIDSPAVSQQLLREMPGALENLTYRVELDKKGRLQWVARIDDKEVIETSEPLTNWWRRFLSGLYRILPESQL